MDALTAARGPMTLSLAFHMIFAAVGAMLPRESSAAVRSGAPAAGAEPEPCREEQNRRNAPVWWSEDDCGVEHHEGEESLDRPPAHRAASRFRAAVFLPAAAAAAPPRGGIPHPQQREGIVEVQPAAPGETCDFGRLPRGVLPGPFVTPAVMEVERAGDMEQVQQASRSPQQACDALGPRRARGIHQQSPGVAADREPHRPLRQQGAVDGMLRSEVRGQKERSVGRGELA